MILVTGGTSGLGRRLVGELVAAGATVIVHGRSEAKVERVRAETEEALGQAKVLTVLADLAAIKSLVRVGSI